MVYMAGNMTPREHCAHIYDAAYIYDGSIDEAEKCCIGIYCKEISDEGYQLHLTHRKSLSRRRL